MNELLLGGLLLLTVVLGFCVAWLITRSNAQGTALKNLLLENNSRLERPIFEAREATIERLGELKQDQLRELMSFRDQLVREQKESFKELGATLEGRLSQGLEKTNKSFIDLMERLAKIDEAQRKIESLSMNVVSLQDVLTDKKARGIFGEVQLKNLLENVFGENQRQVYSLQTKMSNETIVDALLVLPEPVGKIAVDSKFPLENYKRMIDRTIPEEQSLKAQKDFVSDLKKHIDAIADKYIIPNETSDQAILFLPAEAIFAEIHAYHDGIVAYAHKRRVWIASPTTFMATLTSLQTVLVNIERSKYIRVIHEEINLLGKDFERFEKRWDDLSRHLDTVSKDVGLIHTSSQKITSRFKKINDVELEQRIES
jgi:DNA recombination protein RmuC